jgi:hypothetical protein
VFVIVALSFAFVTCQVVRSLAGRSSRAGSCCAKGCVESPQPSAQDAPRERVVFIPLDALTRQR